MADIETVRIRRRCWRVLAPRWAHAPLSGAGAARHGGRYNAPGTPALYLSEGLLTAIAEYEQELGIRPGTFCAYELDVAEIVDLMQETTHVGLGITREDLLAPWQEIAFVRGERPPTWVLAQRLQEGSCAGARVPSAALPNTANFVLWRWNDGPCRRVVAHDPLGDLPLSLASVDRAAACALQERPLLAPPPVGRVSVHATPDEGQVPSAPSSSPAV